MLSNFLRFGFAKVNKIRTHYQLLEIPTTASSKDIKKNFIKLAKIYHPDVYRGSDKERFTKIKQAYETLINQQSRQKYDEQLGLRQPSPEPEQPNDKPAAESNEPYYKTTGVRMDYTVNVDSMEDLEKEYQEFFGKGVNTKFEEIRIVEEPEFRQMTEKERISRRFKQIHNDPWYTYKTIHLEEQKFEEVVSDQIKQRNLHLEDEEEDRKQAELKQTPEYISKKKKQILWACGGISLIFFPLLISVITRKRLEKERELEILRKMEQELQEEELSFVQRRLGF